LLRVPGKPNASVPILRSKVPKSDGFVVLPQPLLKAMVKLAGTLKGLDEMWVIGGNAGELALGVGVTPDHLDILTTKKGCDAICALFSKLQSPPAATPVVATGDATASPQTVPEKSPPPASSIVPTATSTKVEREAEIDGKKYPVYVWSHYAEFKLDGVQVKVYGDLQIKVGEWEWGTPLIFEPSNVNIVGATLPIFPLRLKSELYLGLGWMDRVEKISDAFTRSQPHP